MKFLVTDRIGTTGWLQKETAEVGRVIIDFGCWLDPGEVLGSVSRFSLRAADYNPVAASWQVDYPLDFAEQATIVDSVPLVLTGATIVGGKVVNVLLGAGTPGLTYIASFIAIASTSGREKQIDILVAIPRMSNDAMISSLTPAQSVSFTTVSGTAALALGTVGTVYVENGANAEITITLPPSPATGQRVRIVDALGNAATYTIHIQGYGGVTILGSATYDLGVDYQGADFEWNGTQWTVS
jgi:hypothetical protein